MIGLDTNILIRHLTQDDVVQATKVSRLLSEKTREGESFFINRIVLCELVWVLESAYGYSKTQIIEVMEKILITKQFEFEDSDLVWFALTQFRKSKADFSDLLIGLKNRGVECRTTLTLDKSLKGIETFELV